MGELTNAVRLELLAIGISPMLLVGALAWLFRAHLQESLARRLNAHTERVKLDAQREIEAYKVTLIASVERQKAQSELKKAIAIKHATLEYEALVLLHARLADVPTEVLSAVRYVSPGGSTEEQRVEACARLLKKLELLQEAADGAHLFISAQQSLALIDLKEALLRLMSVHLAGGADTLPSDDQCKAVNDASAKLRNTLRDRVADLIRLTEGEPTS